MKILHIIFSLNIGGAETMLVDLVNEQVQTEVVELIVINDSTNELLVSTISKRIKLHFLRRVPGSLNIFKILQLNYLIFKIQPTVVHFHNHNGIQLVKSKPARTCLTVHSIDVPTDFLYKYGKLFSISNSVKHDIYQRCAANSIRIYNGIDFAKIDVKSVYAKRGEFKIVQISRLVHEIKGQHFLLQAVNELVYKHHLSNIQLDFIGEGLSLSYLKQLTAYYKLENYVRFLGGKTRSFIYENLKNYDLLVQPSIHEGFGLSIVEGLAAGLPVIVSDVDGPAEIVKIMPFYWLFQSENSLELTKAILEIMSLYRSDEIEGMCKENYLAASRYFSIKQTAQNYIQHYG